MATERRAGGVVSELLLHEKLPSVPVFSRLLHSPCQCLLVIFHNPSRYWKQARSEPPINSVADNQESQTTNQVSQG